MKLHEIGDDRTPFTTKPNGDLFYKGQFIENYGDPEEALELAPEVVIGPDGVEYVDQDSGFAYINKVRDVVVAPDYVVGEYLYKATDNVSSPQIPGFMTDEESVQQYLPTGSRSRNFGGTQLIRARIDQIGRIAKSELVDTANFGYVLLLAGTPSVLDFGVNDGILVLQATQIEIVG